MGLHISVVDLWHACSEGGGKLGSRAYHVQGVADEVVEGGVETSVPSCDVKTGVPGLDCLPSHKGGNDAGH